MFDFNNISVSYLYYLEAPKAVIECLQSQTDGTGYKIPIFF